MELSKIEKLLEAYFEGQTNLEEEGVLMDYFCNRQVADHLLQYKLMFIGLAATRQEHSKRTFEIPESAVKKNPVWRYAIAGVLVVAIGIGSLILSKPGLTAEEQEALTAFEDSKEALLFLSENLNKGAHRLSYVDLFEDSKSRVFKDEDRQNEL